MRLRLTELTALMALLIAPCLAPAWGCNKAADPNDKEQVKQAHDLNMENLNATVSVLQTANVPFMIKAKSSGKPSLFQHLNLGIDTGLEAELIAWGNFGNSAAGAVAPPPVTAETIAMAIVMALQRVEQNRRPEIPITVDEVGGAQSATKPKEPDVVTVKAMQKQNAETPADTPQPPNEQAEPPQADTVNHPDSQGLNPESHDGGSE